MIKLENIHKYFSKDSAAEVYALRGVSLELNPGDFMVILGANGSGKSTLLNVISGKTKPDSGSILFDDRDVTRANEHERSRMISRVFQNPTAGTAPDLTILENFRLAALRTTGKNLKIGINNKFRDLVRSKIASLQLGLEDKTDQLMGTLSGGQRQALTLLMAVMDDTRLLLMDEPASALDPKTSQQLMQIANNLIAENNLTAIMVTHNLKEAGLYGNRLIQMASGMIVNDLRGDAKKKTSVQEMLNWF